MSTLKKGAISEARPRPDEEKMAIWGRPGQMIIGGGVCTLKRDRREGFWSEQDWGDTYDRDITWLGRGLIRADSGTRPDPAWDCTKNGCFWTSRGIGFAEYSSSKSHFRGLWNSLQIAIQRRSRNPERPGNLQVAKSLTPKLDRTFKVEADTRSTQFLPFRTGTL